MLRNPIICRNANVVRADIGLVHVARGCAGAADGREGKVGAVERIGQRGAGAHRNAGAGELGQAAAVAGHDRALFLVDVVERERAAGQTIGDDKVGQGLGEVPAAAPEAGDLFCGHQKFLSLWVPKVAMVLDLSSYVKLRP